MTRLIQIQKGDERRVALVDEPRLRLLANAPSIYSLANQAIRTGKKLSQAAEDHVSGESLDYDLAYQGRAEWRILAPIDHPEPARCLASGTGLTHLGSAR